MLWALASPPALIVATIKLVFFYSRLSSLATLLYILVALVAIGGLVILSVERETRPVECECPACGARVWFEFTLRSIEPEQPIARCDKCLVYVSQHDSQISEVSLEMTSENQGFTVFSNQYEANVRRKDDGGIAFDLPAFCAVCGAGDAPHQREIVIHFADTQVNTEVWRQLNYARTGSRGHGMVMNSAPTRITGRDFLHFRVPVCAEHREPTTRPSPLETDDWGSLDFASYRFYKAFIVANHIMPPGAEGLPPARVRT
jgi:hypothetical protein